MRKILYRAWLKDTNKMVEVGRINFQNNTIVYLEPIYVGSKVRRYNKAVSFNKIELLPCTNLKDKNGRDIFEGDILRVKQLNGETEIIKVCYGEYVQDGEFYLGYYAEFENQLTLSLVGGKSVVSHPEKFFEVIGNKFENSELLEV